MSGEGFTVSRLDTDPEALKLARRLGLNGRQELAKETINFCLAKIKEWVQEAGTVWAIMEPKALVCEKLQLVIEGV